MAGLVEGCRPSRRGARPLHPAGLRAAALGARPRLSIGPHPRVSVARTSSGATAPGCSRPRAHPWARPAADLRHDHCDCWRARCSGWRTLVYWNSHAARDRPRMRFLPSGEREWPPRRPRLRRAEHFRQRGCEQLFDRGFLLRRPSRPCCQAPGRLRLQLFAISILRARIGTRRWRGAKSATLGAAAAAREHPVPPRRPPARGGPSPPHRMAASAYF